MDQYKEKYDKKLINKKNLPNFHSWRIGIERKRKSLSKTANAKTKEIKRMKELLNDNYLAKYWKKAQESVIKIN